MASMVEKKKWFDQRKNLQLPEPLVAVFCVTEAEVQGLLTHLQQGPADQADKTSRLFRRLAQKTPARRLASNLRALMRLLATETVYSVIPDGLTRTELEALIVLQTRQFPLRLQETAQGLLNVYERCVLLAAVGRMFRLERNRHWEIDLV